MLNSAIASYRDTFYAKLGTKYWGQSILIKITIKWTA